MEISKLSVLLANEHQSDKRNVTNDFRMHVRYVIVHAKTTRHWNARECSIKEDLNQNGTLSIS